MSGRSILSTKNSAAKTQARKNAPLKMLSLFSGCGGMDLGFEGGFKVPKVCVNTRLKPHFVAQEIDANHYLLKKTPFRTVFANDIKPSAQLAWQHYFSARGHKANTFHLGSIVDVVKAQQNGNTLLPQEIDLLTGGFPCQDFSLAGKRGGFKSHKDHLGRIITADENTPSIETRGQLYMWMREVINLTRPKIFIAENVKGLVSLEDVVQIVRQDFSTAGGDGYIVLPPQVLHAADYGIAQSRERVFFIGLRKDALRPEIKTILESATVPRSLSPYPMPTHAFTQKGTKLQKAVSLRSILGMLGEPETSEDPSHQRYSKAKFMGKHCQGQTEIKLDGIAPTIRAEHHGNIEFRRLSSTNGGTYQEELNAGLLERRLSVRECALIQSFPNDYPFVIPAKVGRKRYVVSPSMGYKLVGNAVPPLLAYHIAMQIAELWDTYFHS